MEIFGALSVVTVVATGLICNRIKPFRKLKYIYPALSSYGIEKETAMVFNVGLWLATAFLVIFTLQVMYLPLFVVAVGIAGAMLIPLPKNVSGVQFYIHTGFAILAFGGIIYGVYGYYGNWLLFFLSVVLGVVWFTTRSVLWIEAVFISLALILVLRLTLG